MHFKFRFALALLALVLCAPAASEPNGVATAQTRRAQAARTYTCPMHPEIHARRPGRCPKCNMALQLEKQPPAAPAAANATPAPAAAPNETTARAPESLKVSPRIPDISVYDQTGQRRNFYTDLVKGRTVAINFIFTTCTTICPPLTATFRKVQQELGPRVGQDVQLLSISVDPTTDTPERLKSFAEKFKAGPGWTFVTGSKPEIDQLLAALGAAVADKNDHTPMILVGNDASGTWTRTYGLASPSTLVKVINETAGANAPAAATPTSGAADKSLVDAAARYFPNDVLLTQENKPVRFYDDLLKGKVVLINFMFATCKGVCPPMTANLAKVQQYLGAHIGREVVMISLSVDPKTDTPDVLKKYADNFKAQPGWYFLTGEKESVARVLYKVGGYVEDPAQHSAVLIIGNVATGEWLKMHAMAPPSQIAERVLALLAPAAK
jgi:cytochrome oxidase Cu insertion factor (SCO1/SenC/PrrC family)